MSFSSKIVKSPTQLLRVIRVNDANPDTYCTLLHLFRSLRNGGNYQGVRKINSTILVYLQGKPYMMQRFSLWNTSQLVVKTKEFFLLLELVLSNHEGCQQVES